MDSLFDLDNTLSYNKCLQSPKDAPASLKMRQENRIPKVKNDTTYPVMSNPNDDIRVC